ncbi:hypothetical protein LSH36_457g01024 [Paralvinella palmiformis]|uniref:G-protein coupled receptors family 1 profile domain-containing protein n=1 Tax=Paralvinella palmiformis TaxID=53620 RepID=A0AAD9JA27_9ANNE|nr:hypothetical protein LSH36_457g01024 [Paralvinella palmiformis]
MSLENATFVINGTKLVYDNETPFWFYVIVVGIPLLAGIAVVFNLVTLLVIYKFCGKIRSHYVLIVVQCSADLLASFAYLMFYLTPSDIGMLLPLPYGIFYCTTRFFTNLINASFAFSLMNTLAITLDRFVAVHSPLKYPSVARTSRMRIIAAVMALISLILACTPFFIAITEENPANYPLCEIYYEVDTIIYQLVIGIIVLDTVVMIVVYSYILDKVRRRPVSQSNTGSTYQTTVTSFWIVATFMVFYWPDIICGYLPIPYWSSLIVKSLALVNCIADPLIYGIRLRKIKLGFRKFRSQLSNSSQTNTRSSKVDDKQ